jgi:phosphate starvation-inducible protein PhoH
MAVQALKNKTVEESSTRLTGEKLGFSGTLYEKLTLIYDLYDALYDMMEARHFQRLMDQGTIEVTRLHARQNHNDFSSF